MKLDIEFTIGFEDPSKDYPWIIQRKLQGIKNKLKKYELKKMIGIDHIYKIDETNPIFLEAKQLMYDYQGDITLTIEWLYPVFSSVEMDKAVAYEPYFINKYCFDYDEESNNEYENTCKLCESIDLKENLEIQSKGIKRNSYNTFTLEDNKSVFFITHLMYEYLVENGINPKYFKECYTKRKNIIAYRLYSDNVLDVNAFYDDSYSDSFICSNCGKLYKNLQVDDTYINKYIDENSLDNLEDINITYEYFSKNKKIIVSKKVYNLVKEKDPEAMFLPIYIKHK
ncbi:hypothetical protein [Terrisporobacter petrolearius]|uniref:hypothetical protein n=1 Tax=Terrisporobacter petrolearius TaxID=1460447 RepID=UPI003B0087F8